MQNNFHKVLVRERQSDSTRGPVRPPVCLPVPVSFRVVARRCSDYCPHGAIFYYRIKNYCDCKISKTPSCSKKMLLLGRTYHMWLRNPCDFLACVCLSLHPFGWAHTLWDFFFNLKLNLLGRKVWTQPNMNFSTTSISIHRSREER